MDTLRDLRNGRTHDELSDQLNELVEAVIATRKKGTITLTINVQPATKAHDGSALLLSDEIKLVKPKFDRGASIFYATPENNLQREDPKQRKLNLEGFDGGVDRDTGELVAAPAEKRPAAELEAVERKPVNYD